MQGLWIAILLRRAVCKRSKGAALRRSGVRDAANRCDGQGRREEGGEEQRCHTSRADIDVINRLGQGKLDFTVGSALDIFGGTGLCYGILASKNWAE